MDQESNNTSYDDRGLHCDGQALTIRRYYPWGSKRIPYSAIKGVQRLPLTAWRRWRIWGTSDFLHWWNFDSRRPHKSVALVLDVGTHTRPTITPEHPELLESVLDQHSDMD